MTFERKVRQISTIAAIILLSACGHWPPVVKTQRDVERLPSTEPGVRARGLSDADIPSLERLRDLNNLDFAGGCAVEKARITDAGLARLAKLDLPKLDTLALGYCDTITDAGLEYVRQMHTVTQLLLMGCPRITDAGLPKLLTMKRLKYLDLRGCPGITDRGLEYLVAKTNWEDILLGGCPNVTPSAVAQLQAALPNARVQKDDVEWSQSRCR